jgi:hypothetical protein
VKIPAEAGFSAVDRLLSGRYSGMSLDLRINHMISLNVSARIPSAFSMRKSNQETV